MAKPTLEFEVDLRDWARTVRAEEAYHNDFSGKVFEKYARGLFRRILDVLPPPTIGAGKGSIRRDYFYAYPRGKLLKRNLRGLKRGHRIGFWKAFFAGDKEKMRAILKAAGVDYARLTIAQFDKGKALRGFKRGRWTSRKVPPPLRIIMDPKAVDKHVKEIEGHVGKLKSGLVPALRKLGIQAPRYITNHGEGRGQFVMNVTQTHKMFDWLGLASDYDPALIALLQGVINRAAVFHIAKMEQEMAGYRGKPA